MGFTRQELEAYRDTTVPDLTPDDLRLLFVGINPGLWTAATGAHFARPGNRFYPALYRAGITGFLINPANGYDDDEVAEIARQGIGISNICPRATARADELTAEELRTGAAHLHRLVEEIQPPVVAVLGITAFRLAFQQPKARKGRQESPWMGTALYVAPNPSGLNAHSSLDDLTCEYRSIAQVAGVLPARPQKRSRGAWEEY